MKTEEKAREYNRMRYAWLKSHGICVDCAQRDAFNGFVRCPECLEKHQLYEYEYNKSERRKMLKKARIQKRIEQGLCINCSNAIYEGSNKYCKRCHERHKIASKIAQQNLRAQRRTKTLDEIKAEQSERGKKNIIKCRQHINFKNAIEKRKQFINNEVRLHIAKKGIVVNE